MIINGNMKLLPSKYTVIDSEGCQQHETSLLDLTHTRTLPSVSQPAESEICRPSMSPAQTLATACSVISGLNGSLS